VTASAFSGSGAVLSGVVTGVSSQSAAALTGNVILSPGTNIKITQGGSNITIESTAGGSGTVTSIVSSRGLLSSPNPITTTGILTIDTGVVVTTSDAQTLTSKTLTLPHVGSGITLDATNNYTLLWASPAAARTITIADPTVNDTFTTNVATQTVNFKSLNATNSIDAGAITVGTLNNSRLPANINVTGTVTAAAFMGTFEGTYTGEEIKGASFSYPYATIEASIILPYNITVTSIEVQVEGAAGSSVTGRVMTGNNTVTIGTATVNGSALNTHVWGVGTVASQSISKNTNIEFEVANVTGTVYNATVQIRYKRAP
jgi:hypothetical protein